MRQGLSRRGQSRKKAKKTAKRAHRCVPRWPESSTRSSSVKGQRAIRLELHDATVTNVIVVTYYPLQKCSPGGLPGLECWGNLNLCAAFLPSSELSIPISVRRLTGWKRPSVRAEQAYAVMSFSRRSSKVKSIIISKL